MDNKSAWITKMEVTSEGISHVLTQPKYIMSLLQSDEDVPVFAGH